MIETQFFILSSDQYNEFHAEAQELGISVDYYLSEFCYVEGDMVISVE
jgi:hypothetical protein